MSRRWTGRSAWSRTSRRRSRPGAPTWPSSAGDPERAIAFERQALAELGEGESVLASAARLHLRAAELLRGVLPDAERAFAASMAA
jgi:hypothetical protein